MISDQPLYGSATPGGARLLGAEEDEELETVEPGTEDDDAIVDDEDEQDEEEEYGKEALPAKEWTAPDEDRDVPETEPEVVGDE